MKTFRRCLLRSLQPAVALLLAALLLPASASAAVEIRPFSSDGCSLFPDGTPKDQTKWCDCCFEHDLSYWQGGSAAERLKADSALHDCVMEQTGDEILADAMFFGVRGGGSPAFPTWYRWGYGWDYGRGYQPLRTAEQAQIEDQLATYASQHPQGYCQEISAAEQARPTSWATPSPRIN